MLYKTLADLRIKAGADQPPSRAAIRTLWRDAVDISDGERTVLNVLPEHGEHITTVLQQEDMPAYYLGDGKISIAETWLALYMHERER